MLILVSRKGSLCDNLSWFSLDVQRLLLVPDITCRLTHLTPTPGHLLVHSLSLLSHIFCSDCPAWNFMRMSWDKCVSQCVLLFSVCWSVLNYQTGKHPTHSPRSMEWEAVHPPQASCIHQQHPLCLGRSTLTFFRSNNFEPLRVFGKLYYDFEQGTRAPSPIASRPVSRLPSPQRSKS